MRTPLVASAIALALFSAVPARAGTISADYLPLFGTAIYYSTNLPGHIGPKTTNSGIFLAFRDDLPAGPGVDDKVPFFFRASCVEIGEPLQLPNNNAHATVTHLLNATTNAGGISGPVTFDAQRNERAEKLWGAFLAGVGNQLQAAAFQLALWEISFDDDMTLAGPGTPFYVGAAQFQPGITDLAESWLSQIFSDDATDLLPETRLLLLSAPGVQDVVTPVPEPATAGLVLLAGALSAARRVRPRP
ncbi:MAG: hypothetical protein DCC65_14125 [Planctomycetota bacterium]|nr:MAG: hypothetical protein DCC65_14125 [Planctomycetota bacterium]